MTNINKEEQELLNKIAEEVDKVIDKVLNGWDRSYFEFILICDVLGTNFEKVKEYILLDDREKTYCIFCHEPTRFYDKKRDMHLCAKHYKLLEEK